MNFTTNMKATAKISGSRKLKIPLHGMQGIFLIIKIFNIKSKPFNKRTVE